MPDSSHIKTSLASLYKYVIFLVVLVLSYCYYWYVCAKKQSWWKNNNNNNDSSSTKKLLVVITGCDRGFGRELCEELVKNNNDDSYRYHVLALTLTTQAADELMMEKHYLHDRLLTARKCNVTSDQDVKSMKNYVEEFLKTNDDIMLYAIINNAGAVDPGDFVWYNNSIAPYQHIMDVNFFGQLRITQALLPIMLKQQHTKARIINMSSVCGTSASAGNSAYNASKFAVEAWSDSLRLELKPFDITVVKVRPGQIQTEIQKEWVKKFMERFENASDFIKELYGGDEYRNKAKKVFESSSNNEMTKSHVVVDTLKEILQNPSPKPSYWIGDDALVFWRAMANMHTAVADTVKGSLGISPVITKEKKD